MEYLIYVRPPGTRVRGSCPSREPVDVQLYPAREQGQPPRLLHCELAKIQPRIAQPGFRTISDLNSQFVKKKRKV